MGIWPEVEKDKEFGFFAGITHRRHAMTDGAPLTIDAARAYELIPLLYHQFNHSPDGIFGHRDMPEEILPETVQKGSLEHVIFITLTVSIDYQRDAPALWQSGRHTIDDPETSWLYN